MARIRPFRAIRYGDDHFGALEALISPPAAIERPPRGAPLNHLDPRNILHIVRGSGEDPDNPYQPAAALVGRWLAEGVFVREPQAAVYLLELIAEEGPALNSIFALLHLFDERGQPGAIPHESIERQERVTDIVHAIEACRIQASPVQVIANDDNHAIRSWVQRHDDQRSLHFGFGMGGKGRVSRIIETDALEDLVQIMEPHQLVIADGHHRYEAAVRYRQAVRMRDQLRPGDLHPIDTIFVHIVVAQDPGLNVIGAPSPLDVWRNAVAGTSYGAKATRFSPKAPKGVILASLECF